MKHQVLLGLALFAGLSATSVAAQNDQTKTAPKIVSKGVINASAISLPTPAYPATARAVGAAGAVNVQVTIGEDGSVIAANAVSGHPLLRAGSAEAAQQARFNPTVIAGQPVKISGIIVYNFSGSETATLPTLSWKQVGYEISLAESGDSMPLRFPVRGITSFLPAEWKDEQKALTMLKAKQSVINYNGEDQGKITLASGLADVPPTTIDVAAIDHKTIIGGLKTSIEGRLAAEPDKSWDFRFGTLLGKISAQMDDQPALRSYADAVRQFEITAPADMLENVKQLGDILYKNKLSSDDIMQIAVLIGTLKK